MVKHMKLMGVAGAILLVVAGAAVASNMGFKFTANIATGDPDIYDVSIPLNNNYTSLQGIYDDISASSGCTASSVTIFAPDQSSCSWIGAGSCNAPYNPGKGIRVTTAGGMQYCSWRNSAGGDLMNTAPSGLSDQTMSGTIVSSGNFSVPPFAILGQTAKSALLLIGQQNPWLQ